MKFGGFPPREAEGAVAVHSIRQNGMVLRKGTLIGKPEIAALEAAKVSDIVVARLEPGDVSEDVAAADIAAAVAGEGVHVDRAFTGRANLFAQAPGVLRVFGIVPVLGHFVSAATDVWVLIATVVAVRQALDYRSLPRAFGVCLIGWVLQIVVFLVLRRALV